jgi:hypothetical protein
MAQQLALEPQQLLSEAQPANNANAAAIAHRETP